MNKLCAALVLVVMVACSGGPEVSSPAGTASPSSTTTTPETTPSPSAPWEPTYAFPGPNKRTPRNARIFAREFMRVTLDLPKAIDEWLDNGGRRLSPAGHRIALGALWQQKLYRTLVVRERLRNRVIRRVPRWADLRIERHVKAGGGLRSLASPVDRPVRLKTTPPTPHRRLRRYYKKGERLFDVPWYILASVNFVESKFGRLLGPSSAGAQGPMQFIPSTWDAYGNGGDINDPHDSIVAAARYLSASGAPERMRDALFAYNHSTAYVDAILIYAREIKRDPRNLYSYYFWQVFVLTTDGDLQLTGPGRDR